MTPAPIRWALREGVARIRHVGAVPPRSATGTVARVYAAAEREFGLLPPPLALHSPEPALLAASWLLLRETLLVEGRVDRATKEAVAAAVSLRNACPYCVEVHGAVLGGVHGHADASALAADRIDDIGDGALRAAATWARTGGPGTPPPVAPEDLPELLGVCLTFHHLNRMAHVFLGPSPLPPAVPRAARRTTLGVLGHVLRPAALRGVRPGLHLDLLPPAELPGDLSWAAPDPLLAAALARACRAVEAAGRRVLPDACRAAVAAALTAHPEGTAGLLLDEAAMLDAVPEADRPIARLALLTALAPHRVGDAVVEAFRRRRPAAADLVGAATWAAFTAARQATAASVRTAVQEKTPAPPRGDP
ncbi:hypothetical protein [Geodermatophilus maliterrae]|uniref:Carboxymuconolactone decarboxylase-like domain-containing protein n=1 Tax=Geodermatophilus maliterrae TaxID=3162531 RepID=A0ABV3XA21_9ACTN